MLFTVVAYDKPDSLALRMANREAHLAFARDTAVIKLGGPFLDASGNMNGSFIIFEADDIEAAKRWHAGDPYTRAGLFAHSEVRPWRLTLNFCGAEF